MKCKTLSKVIMIALCSGTLAACMEGRIAPQFSPASAADGNSSQEIPAEMPSPTAPQVVPAPPVFRLDLEAKKFRTRYGLETASEKLTDNRGQGYEDLWGTRNLRVVLHGVMYRGGANNKYFVPARANSNPLPTEGLENLCKEDFGAAVYLYSENFSTAPRSVQCQNSAHQDQVLTYKQYAAAGENEKILALVYDRIKGKVDGPIYAHCWNGWHSSGLIAGMALKQFCGWSNEKVDAYWVKNTDGNSSGFEKIRQRLRDFKPLVKFSITKEERDLICPETF